MPQGDSSHYPSGTGPFFGRLLSTACTRNALWAAVQMEMDKRTTIAVARWIGEERSDLVLDAEGLCHQPQLVSAGPDCVFAVWNELDGETWAIRCALLREGGSGFESTETVHCSDRLCLPPTAAVQGKETWVAWPQSVGESIQIRLSRSSGTGWEDVGAVSPPSIDAFRPRLVAMADGVLLAWDQYRDKSYDIAIVRLDGDDRQEIVVPRQDGERCLCPKIAVTPNGTAYATWLVVRDVADPHGVIDHLPFAAVARIEGDGAVCLAGESNPVDKRMVADLRDGLLASADHTYRGYAGLRRNPALAVGEDGAVWCLWESRFGHEDSSTAGHLLGRRLREDDTWTPPAILHAGGYAYSTGPCLMDGTLPVSFLRSGGQGMEIVGGELVALDETDIHAVDHRKWERWQDIRIEPGPTRQRASEPGKGDYALFWADTHCHSIVSSDAEGEVDELIHFARDTAGLDAVCIIDNDFYPHKALTHVEWEIHQRFCDHFTVGGEFVAFPGWEYTYHRRDLTPDFNHRCILYPRPGRPIFRRIDPEAREDKDLFAQLKGTPAMCYPHHSTYEIVDPELDWGVEVCSSWRVCIEENDFTMKQLLSGRKLGFIGSSDSHRGVPGLGGALTGVFAEGLTPEQLFDAYRKRRTIATQGHRVFIELRVGDAFIGEEAEAEASPQVTARVEAPEPIEFVEIVRDAEVIRRIDGGGDACNAAFEDEGAAPGEHFYFVRVKLVGDPSFNEDPAKNFLGPFIRNGRYGHNLARAKGPYAWTSPIWITLR